MKEEDNLKTSFNVKTDIIDGHIIEQKVEQLMNDAVINVSTEIINLKDKQVYDALISLGWTPPPQIILPN